MNIQFCCFWCIIVSPKRNQKGGERYKKIENKKTVRTGGEDFFFIYLYFVFCSFKEGVKQQGTHSVLNLSLTSHISSSWSSTSFTEASSLTHASMSSSSLWPSYFSGFVFAFVFAK